MWLTFSAVCNTGVSALMEIRSVGIADPLPDAQQLLRAVAGERNGRELVSPEASSPGKLLTMERLPEQEEREVHTIMSIAEENRLQSSIEELVQVGKHKA